MRATAPVPARTVPIWELLDVLLREDIAARFTHVAIGSGDGVFAAPAAILSPRACVWVTV